MLGATPAVDFLSASRAPPAAPMKPASEPSFEAPVETHHGDRTYSLESVARSPAESAVVLKVRDRRQLAQVVRSIRTIPGVVRVSRSAS